MLRLQAPTQSIQQTIELSGSKSSSNRMLLLEQILNSPFHLKNCSDSEDTRLLKQALDFINTNTLGSIDINHAGTTMRFLTAYLAITPGEWLLTGSERMQQRPVEDLVETLRSLGANITYKEKSGFPPLQISGKKLNGGTVSINANISSQFVSALLLIAPTCQHGLELQLQGDVVSAPYIQMTLEMLKLIGMKYTQSTNKIKILPTTNFNLPQEFLIESDWSSASYWYSICALSSGSRIKLKQLNKNSWQADSLVAELFLSLGVMSEFINNELVITNTDKRVQKFEFDFTICPDIAQTIAVVCFALGMEANLTGLKTLRIKETDRITALKIELEKLGAQLSITNDSLKISKTTSIERLNTPIIETYNDHRMALSFAPLALVYNSINILDEDVVTKSYPTFWEDLKSAGFSVNLQP
jgi:3-phosphoshikimate 1-carboxyvinyltransferase